MRSAFALRIITALVLSFTENVQLARVLEDLEQILAQEDLAAAEGQEEDPGVGQLIEQVLDLGRRHLAVVVVVEIAVHAALVAAVGEVELHAERNPELQRLGCPSRASGCSWRSLGGATVSGIGESDSRSMPWPREASRPVPRRRAAPRRGPRRTSAQMCCSTISASGVTPSAACQRTEAVAFS